MSRGKEVQIKCGRCGSPFMARVADRARGWGKFCSKSCKAIKQEATTGQYAAHQNRQKPQRLHPFVSNETYLEHQREYGGIPQFNRRGEYEGFAMTPEDLSHGGYNNAGPNDPFGDGKW
jgi:hypothetical protein